MNFAEETVSISDHNVNGEGNNSEHLRISQLERKVQDQTDEIVCLRSTLADVLRRVTQLEGRASVITSNHVPIKETSPKMSKSYGMTSSNNTSPLYHSSSSIPQNSYKHRRLVNHPSTNSVASESGQSSNSASPVPSPLPSNNHSARSSPRQTPIPVKSNGCPSNLMSMKKWSLSHDFGSNSNSKYTNNGIGSLLNLHVQKQNSTLHLKHGTKEVYLNQEEGTIRIYLRGRPLVLHIPTEYLQSYTSNKVNGLPNKRLKLEWVYGYRGRDCRSNLFLLPTGEVIYFIASVVILYNVEDQIQRHYLGHTDDIKCITVHPNRLMVASGQVASLDRRERKPLVRIWDSVSLNTLQIIGINGDFDRAICCLAFSKLDGGSHLCVIDESPEHTISLWDWQRGEKGLKICETKTGGDPVLACEFHPMDKYSIITIGKGHIHFWDIEGGTLAKKLGIFDKHEKPKFILSVAFRDTGELITGDSNGNIMVWQRGLNKPIRVVHNAHEGGIFAICALKDGTYITGGGKDRRIVEFDADFSKTGREAKLPEQYGGIRTLTQGKGSMVFVGTTRNCLLQGTLALNFSLVIQGHIEEIWALAVHPNQNQFLSGGYDRSIHLWDTMSHSVVWSKDIGEMSQSACFSPDGSVIVVATTIGRWFVIDASTRQLLSTHTDGNERFDCVKFSPNGNLLALGSHDNHIYIYQVSDEYKKYDRMGRCLGHSSFVTHMDWTSDGTYLQSNSGDYELLFWNPSLCRQLNNMSIARDLKFDTHNCILGFNVFGIWPENADGTDINTCDRSHDQKIIATGDDSGRVNLFSFPACQSKCLHHSYSGHSSHITAVRFLHDDTRLISVGGKDCSIMQWSVL